MDQRTRIKEGMTVRSMDGHRLGKVYAVGESEFHIEKGLFFPKDYSVRYTEVSDLVEGDIILSHGKESLRPFSSAELYDRLDPLDSGRVSPAVTAATWRTPEEYAAQPMDRRIEGLRTEDLGDQEVGARNTEGARASPFLTEEDRAVERPAPRVLPQQPGMDLPLRHEAPRPVMRASSEAERVMVTEDELYDEPRRMERRGDADLDKPRRLDLSGESDLKKRDV